MKSTEARRLKELELENQRLKLMLAEAELDKRMLKVIAEGNKQTNKLKLEILSNVVFSDLGSGGVLQDSVDEFCAIQK
jgi:cell shape-determining protein MreC